MMHTKKRNLIILLILASSYNSIYSLVTMKGLYYSLMLSGLSLTHFELGQLYSFYGIFAMFSYLCGAFFLNRFPRWKLASFCCLIVGLLTLCLVFIPPYFVILLIFGIIGFLIGATFYPTHLEILRQLCTPVNQGAIFGLFFLLNNAFGSLFAAIGFGISSLPFSDVQLTKALLIFFAALNLLGFALSFIFFRQLPEDEQERSPLSIYLVREVLSNKRMWVVTLIVFVNYIAYSSINYTLPLLTDRFDLPAGIINILSIMRMYLIGIVAAPIAGRITDRIRSATRLMGYSFILHCVVVVLMLVLFRDNVVGTVICVLLMCLFIYMGKSMALVTIDEAHIPPHLYGIAISIISFAAYSPDSFYYSFSGWIMDAAPVYNYEIIFAIAIVFSLVGIIAVRMLNRKR